MLAACRTHYGPGHLQNWKAMGQLAWACLGTERHAEAIHLEEEVLVTSRAINGPNHGRTTKEDPASATDPTAWIRLS